MNLNKIFLLFLLISQLCVAQVEPNEDWLKNHSVSLEDDGLFNFEEIGNSIGNARIVAIGESTHGIAEYYELKSKLVEYLYEEKGFEILAMEAGLGDVGLAVSDMDSLNARELRDATVFGNFRTVEIMPLYELIASSRHRNSSLIYTGFDSQSSSDYFQQKLQKIIRPFQPSFSDSLEYYFSSYYRMGEALRSSDSLKYIANRDLYIKTSIKAMELLARHKSKLLSKDQLDSLDYRIIIKTLEGYSNSVNLSYENRWNGIALRDSIMADNLSWLLDSIYPNKKMIIWAHNAHVERSSINQQIRFMGHILGEKYKEDYYSIGLFATEGKAYRFWTDSAVEFSNRNPDNIENILSLSGYEITFLPIRGIESSIFTQWMFETVKAFELENGGSIEFIPIERFDAFINVRTGKPPSFTRE